MKHLLLLLLLAVTPLAAQNVTFKKTIDTFTTTGTSDSVSTWTGRFAATYHTISVDETNTSTCSYTVEGTINNEDWFDLTGAQSCTSDAMIHIVNRVVTKIRINLGTLTSGGDPTVEFDYFGVAE